MSWQRRVTSIVGIAICISSIVRMNRCGFGHFDVWVHLGLIAAIALHVLGKHL